MNAVRAAALLAILALAACGPYPSEPEEEEEDPAAEVAEAPAESPCCTIDDVIAMHRAEVDEEIILTSVQTSANDLNPSAQDLIRLSEAGVSKRVVKAMMGEDPGDGDEAAADEVAAPAAAAGAAAAAKPAAPKKPAGPPPLGVMVAYTPGSKTLTLTNSSGKTYTGLVLTANDEYVYALPIPLPPGNPDKIRIGSFTSPKTGHKLYPAEGLRTLSIKADQGRWSKRF